MKKELNMDDIGSIASKVCDDILEELLKYKLSVKMDKVVDIVDNDIFEDIRSKLEIVSNGNYPHQM